MAPWKDRPRSGFDSNHPFAHPSLMSGSFASAKTVAAAGSVFSAPDADHAVGLGGRRRDRGAGLALPRVSADQLHRRRRYVTAFGGSAAQARHREEHVRHMPRQLPPWPSVRPVEGVCMLLG